MKILRSKDLTWFSAASHMGSCVDSPVFPLIRPSFPLNGARPAPYAARRPEYLDAILRDEQRVQVKQGWSVVADTGPIALPTRMGATEGGMSGPYPWRQLV